MTDTQTPATQAQLDAMTYDMYVDQGLNKAATARQMGISASTVADRVKRHSLRLTQDQLADSIALDAEQAAQDAEYAADSEAAEQAPGLDADQLAERREIMVSGSLGLADMFDRHAAAAKEQAFAGALLGVMSGAVSVDEAYAALTGETATEDPDESLAALPEQGDPETAAALAKVREDDAKVRAMGSVPNPNEAHAVEIELHAASKRAEAEAASLTAVTVDGTVVAMTERHNATSQDGQPEDTDTDPQLQAERDALMSQSCDGCGVEVSEDGGEIEHLDNCPDAPVAETAPEPAKAERITVTECVKCGFRFSRPQTRTTCQSDKACQRRQAAKVAA